MKKLLLLAVLTNITLLVNAQSTPTASTMYKAFKVDIDLGYATPSNGTGTKGGVSFTIEPHYRLSDEFALGLRIEGAGLGYQTVDASGNDKTKVSLLISYCATGDYYFMNGGFRPFAGAGAGFFSQQSIVGNKGSGGVTTVPGATNFGFFPRVGFEAGHLRISAAYDIVGNNQSYASFTLGVFFGGGKK
jgi:hypothetical protein